MVSTKLGIKRGAEEATDQWWRRLHRAGHEVMKERNLSLSNMAERFIHRWGGHVARLATSHWVAEMVRGERRTVLDGRSNDTLTYGQQSARNDNLLVGSSDMPMAQRRVHVASVGEH